MNTLHSVIGTAAITIVIGFSVIAAIIALMHLDMECLRWFAGICIAPILVGLTSWIAD